MSGFGSVEAVVAAIREDALEETQRIEREGGVAVRRLQQEDAALPVVVADADARLAAARTRARERLAVEDWSDRQSALKAREAWVAAVVAAAEQRLEQRPAGDRLSGLVTLACEALDRLTAAECTLLVSIRDRAIIDAETHHQLERTTGKRVTVTADGTIAGGCIAESRDGRIRFDNTYAARVRRFEPVWRRALGERFDRLLVPVHA